jgi:hypothetical protein
MRSTNVLSPSSQAVCPLLNPLELRFHLNKKKETVMDSGECTPCFIAGRRDRFGHFIFLVFSSQDSRAKSRN